MIKATKLFSTLKNTIYLKESLRGLINLHKAILHTIQYHVKSSAEGTTSEASYCKMCYNSMIFRVSLPMPVSKILNQPAENISGLTETFDMVYMDPPFGLMRDFTMVEEDGTQKGFQDH